MRQATLVAALVGAAFFSIYLADLFLGFIARSFGGPGSFLGDLRAALTLFTSVIAFVVVLLLLEAQQKAESAEQAQQD